MKAASPLLNHTPPPVLPLPLPTLLLMDGGEQMCVCLSTWSTQSCQVLCVSFSSFCAANEFIALNLISNALNQNNFHHLRLPTFIACDLSMPNMLRPRTGYVAMNYFPSPFFWFRFWVGNRWNLWQELLLSSNPSWLSTWRSTCRFRTIKVDVGWDRQIMLPIFYYWQKWA